MRVCTYMCECDVMCDVRCVCVTEGDTARDVLCSLHVHVHVYNVHVCVCDVRRTI